MTQKAEIHALPGWVFSNNNFAAVDTVRNQQDTSVFAEYVAHTYRLGFAGAMYCDSPAQGRKSQPSIVQPFVGFLPPYQINMLRH